MSKQHEYINKLENFVREIKDKGGKMWDSDEFLEWVTEEATEILESNQRCLNCCFYSSLYSKCEWTLNNKKLPFWIIKMLDTRDGVITKEESLNNKCPAWKGLA